MNRSAISLTLWTIFLILAQALVFNHVCLFGYAVAFVFIYTFVKLPLTMSKEWLFTIAFVIGMTIDIFSDTLGMNALASLITIALRRPVIRLYVTRDDELTNPYPGFKSFGTISFCKYVLTITGIYCTLLFLIESFSIDDAPRIILQIICSTLLSTMLLIGIDSLTIKKSEKRL